LGLWVGDIVNPAAGTTLEIPGGSGVASQVSPLLVRGPLAVTHKAPQWLEVTWLLRVYII